MYYRTVEGNFSIFFQNKICVDLTLKIFVCLIIINVTYWKLPILIIGKNVYFWQFIFKKKFLNNNFR